MSSSKEGPSEEGSEKEVVDFLGKIIIIMTRTTGRSWRHEVVL
jgi:hypothetical protein